jgi:mycothiol synthase
MIELRRVESDADYDSWAVIKTEVIPEGPVTGEEMRRSEQPERLLLLADLDGATVACGIASPSSFPDACFVGPRVLAHARGHGVGEALLRRLAAHGTGLGRERLIAHVDAADERSRRFASRFGFVEIDRQIMQVRQVGNEAPPQPPDRLRLASVAERPELLREAWERVAVEAYADLPLPDAIEVSLDEWLCEEATWPEGSFVALDEDEVVGYAGLLRVAATPGAAEHGLTAVRRDRRGRGVATALKRAQLAWAAASGVRELVTWTQRGNEDMQRLNARLGYLVACESMTARAPLPLRPA